MSTTPESGPLALSSKASFHFLRLALGIIYFHFGFLKFFPDLSPAELLATQTIVRLTGGMLDANTAQFWLAMLECGLGLALIFNVWMRAAFVVFLFHMLGTFTPLFLLPELAFKISPLAPTLEGQYILKNIVFVAAAWAVFVPELFGNAGQTRHSPLLEPSEPKLKNPQSEFTELTPSFIATAGTMRLQDSPSNSMKTQLEKTQRANQ